MRFQLVQQVIEDIRTAWREGRGIVPVLGAGFSAEAGLPTIEGVTRYLAELRGYVRERGPMSAVPVSRLDRTAEYEKDLSRFVKDHGWPDYYHLHQNFGRQLSERQLPGELEEEIYRQFDELAALLYPEQVAKLEDVLQEIGRTHADTFMPRQRHSEGWKLLGRWPDLVHQVTGGDVDYARGLFERLQHGRRAALSHRFLAFLTRLLGIPLFFSTTFDDLLEEALRAEQVDHTVFALEAGRRFPSPGQVRKTTAVVRMDGDLHNLLGGPMYLPLEQTCLKDFEDCLPHRPLLLVLGSSGGDRRVLDMVRRVARHPDCQGLRSVLWLHYEAVVPPSVTSLPELDESSCRFVRVIHPGLFLSHLYAALTSRHPASSKAYLAHPQRPIGLQPRDAVPEKLEPARTKAGVRLYHNRTRSCYLFTNLPLPGAGGLVPKRGPGGAPVRPAMTNASERLAAFVNNLPLHTPIWIDLEAQYTLAGVVGAIIDQCRTYDPLVTPSVLPLGEDDTARDLAVGKGASRVLDALSRGRYVLALDALEAYTWPHTVHHGDLESDSEDPQQRRLLIEFLNWKRRPLIEFLKRLIEGAEQLHSSLVCMSLGPPESRRCDSYTEMLDALAAVEVELRAALGAQEQDGWVYPNSGQGQAYIAPGPGNDLAGVLAAPAIAPPDGTTFRWAAANPDDSASRLALLCLSCFRRTRHLVGLRGILGPLVLDGSDVRGEESYRRVDEALEWFIDAEYLLPVEGGGYWMRRQLRDEIYAANSSQTGTAVLRGLVQGLQDRGQPRPEALVRTILQCLLLSFHHDRIARYYYFNNYVQSQDAFAFFEYVYHRVSSIRYLTRLVLLRAVATNRDPSIWTGVSEVCTRVLSVVPEEHFDIQPGDIEKLLNPQKRELRVRRTREIRSLRLTWQRSRAAIQQSVPAEQLISWCRWLIEDDLPRFRSSEYGKRIGVHGMESELAELDEPTNAVEELKEDLYDLWAQSSRERSGYDECIRRRLEQQILFTAAHKEDWGDDEFNRNWQESGVKESQAAGDHETARQQLKRLVDHYFKQCKEDDPCRVLSQMLPPGRSGPLASLRKVCHWWLDIVECLSVQDRQQVFNHPASSPPPSFHRTAKLLNKISGFCGKPLPGRIYCPPHDDSTRTLRFRCRLLRGEHDLGRVTFWRSGYLYQATELSPTEKIKCRVYKLSRKALIDIRQHDLEEGRAYLEYRANFLIARARARILQFPPPFHDAYRDLELARGGVRLEDRLLRARADLFGVEFTLIEVDELLTREAGLRRGEGRKPIGKATNSQLLERAAAKFAVARAYLQRLPAHLLETRRNTVWWKFFFQLIAQYDSERNLWAMADTYERLGDPADADARVSDGKAAKFLARLRGGLLAVRRGLDRDLDPEHFDPWLKQVWREMFFCSVLFWKLADVRPGDGRTAFTKRLSEPPTQPEEKILKSWWDLNRSVGLLVGKDWDKWGWEGSRPLLVKLWKDESVKVLAAGWGKTAPGQRPAIPSDEEAVRTRTTGLHLRHGVGQIAQPDVFELPLLQYRRR